MLLTLCLSLSLSLSLSFFLPHYQASMQDKANSDKKKKRAKSTINLNQLKWVCCMLQGNWQCCYPLSLCVGGECMAMLPGEMDVILNFEGTMFKLSVHKGSFIYVEKL